MNPLPAPFVGFDLGALQAQHRHRVRFLLQSFDEPLVEEHAVRGEKEDDLREVTRDVHHLRAGERLAARDDEERDAEPRGLSDDVPHVAGAQLVGRISANRLGVTSPANEDCTGS